jgi:VWFA-related protein
MPSPSEAQTVPPSDQRLRVETQEILLDMVVRDKKGRFVLDLKPEEVTIFEDGVPQKATGFRLVDRGAPPAPPEGAGPTQPDPFRHLNLVTLVFERVGGDPEPRKLAREAAMHFLNTELRENVYVALFIFDARLRLLEPFTNDRKRLREAVEAATSGSFNEYMVKAEERNQALRGAAGAQAAASESAAGAVIAGSNRQSPNVGQIGSAMIAAAMAQITRDILMFSESVEREQQSAASMNALLALIRGQERLAGRKTVLYFSQGLQVTTNRNEIFRDVIGIANRSHVSFYTVDVTGLNSGSKMGGMQVALQTAAAASMEQTTRDSGPISMGEVRAGETAETSTRANTQETLSALATETGGQLIANSNDLRSFMGRVSEDIRHYYEVTYAPAAPRFDGRFREISVRLSRPNVKVQARSGYFALPPAGDGPVLQTYEIPLMNVLNTTPPPRDFEYRILTLRYGKELEGIQHSLAMEVPLSNLTFRADETAKTYQAHLSFIGLIKNSEGGIIKKVSRDFPLSGDLSKIEEVKRGKVSLLEDLHLPPGRYTLETALLDRLSNQASTRRSLLMVREVPAGLSMSSLAVIKRVERNVAGSLEYEDPIQTSNTRITLNLGDPIQAGPRSRLFLYFVAYPSQDSLGETHLRLQILENGLVISDSSLALPPPNESGQIPFIATIPAMQFKAGNYEAKAIVWQGNKAVEEHTFFSMGETLETSTVK